MTINLQMPEIKELKPKITVFGVGGAGGNAVNNMIRSGLEGCEFVVANTDSQALTSSRAGRLIQMGVAVTEGLGAGSQPEVGRAAAEEAIDEITDHLTGSHMVFVTAGMGGGTGTGAAPIIARAARDQGILTVGVVTKPFQFEGARRMRLAEQGIRDLQACVDTLIVIPNQNLFRIANEKTTFADAFAMADQVLFSGVACITDLMVKEGLINLDFADVRSVMREMGKAMMGTGEASGERRAIQAAEAAIANPLLDETSMKGAKGLLISITGGKDLTLFEVDEAATRIREEVDPDANIILGATFEESLEGVIRVSVVATGIEKEAAQATDPIQAAAIQAAAARMAEIRTEQPAAATPVIPTQARPRPVPRPAVAQAAAPVQPRQAPQADYGSALAAAMEQAEMHDPGVTIQPFNAAPVAAQYEEHEIDLDMTAAPAEEHVEVEMEAPFIPPQPEAPPSRMPKIEDFPAQTQRELAQQNRPVDQEDRGPLSLLRRLAGVGLGRREEDPVPAARPQQSQTRQQQPAAQRPQPRVQMPPPPPAPDYAKRPPQPRVAGEGLYKPRAGELDPHGRQMPREQRGADDELEIPAFLRRQAN